jgi:hypothetical protein
MASKQKPTTAPSPSQIVAAANKGYGASKKGTSKR